MTEPEGSKKPPSRGRRILLLAGIVLAFCLAGVPAAGTWWLYNQPYLAANDFPRQSEAVIADFAATQAPTREDYRQLVGYFVDGFLTYAAPRFTGAHYPGLPSGYAERVQDMEAFTRIAPLLAVWLKWSDGETMTLPSGRVVNIAEILKSGVLVGTDAASDAYWGDIQDRDQRLAEAADVALALWISREKLWDKLAVAQRGQIARWLNQVNGKQIADNNWHLFSAQVNVALQALGAPYDQQAIETHLARVRTFYRDDGWFADGVDGPVDFYNAWGFQYQMGWIQRMNPELLDDLLDESLPLFSADLLHLLGPHGFPIMGRSVCYRLAVTSPLIFASQSHPDVVAPPQARRALDLTWRYFLSHGAARDGRITQGYCGDDPAMLDNYSGAGSCLWSLRSLIAALDLPDHSPFWREPAAPLPVELGDFERSIAGGTLRARGDKATGNVTLITTNALPDEATRIQPFTFKARLKSYLLGGGRRPHNEEAKYRRAEYSSNEPFCGCAE